MLQQICVILEITIIQFIVIRNLNANSSENVKVGTESAGLRPSDSGRRVRPTESSS